MWLVSCFQCPFPPFYSIWYIPPAYTRSVLGRKKPACRQHSAVPRTLNVLGHLLNLASQQWHFSGFFLQRLDFFLQMSDFFLKGPQHKVYCEAKCFGTKEHKSNNRPNVLGQDLFEMHTSRAEYTSFLWRSTVDFLFEKGINILKQ